MKKWLIFPLLLLLLLTACQTVSNSETEPAGSTPPSSSITPRPSSMSVTTPPPTSTPVFDVNDGLAFVTDDHPNVVLSPDWIPPSDCLVNHLYWVVKSTKECILICDEPIYSRAYARTDTHICFVKESEPTKIYAAPIGDFANHQLLYESPYGTVTYMTNLYYYTTGIENYLQFVADEKKFVLLDMTTGESTVFMEQYYIGHAYISPGEDGSLFANWIWFEGKHKETDSPYAQFFYNRETGETTPDTSL